MKWVKGVKKRKNATTATINEQENGTNRIDISNAMYSFDRTELLARVCVVGMVGVRELAFSVFFFVVYFYFPKSKIKVIQGRYAVCLLLF